ncbi:MAG: enoyl-CoA hydratase-related protein [Proteobacteria bacterium]|nr:enoyl-CoA hydratase-related protein [Cystobacterineae bacterium]MCL2258365.1 enoyl-CoA hydratase-related protein [Cystobacterineae bacterium]MCL2315272.1 enoyl-CoA hydratase-related protein [Pseudomonadota bacterium]
MHILKIEPEGSIEQWTLNREPMRNALSRELVEGLRQQVARIGEAGSGVRAVVLTGAGDKAFCAGADLKERQGMSAEEVRKFLQDLRALLVSLERSRCIFIAFVNGAALGGGTELALACDLRIASSRAQLGLTEVCLGIIPGGGGTQRLPRLIGAGKAKELIFCGRRVGAEEALRIGLVEGVGGLADARAMAFNIAANAPIAVAAAKQAIAQGAHLPMEEALALELQFYEQTLASEDRLEGLKAFSEKRPARFVGR